MLRDQGGYEELKMQVNPVSIFRIMYSIVFDGSSFEDVKQQNTQQGKKSLTYVHTFCYNDRVPNSWD